MHYGIEGFWRFKDDGLVLGTNRGKAQEFLREYKKRASFFRVNIESVNSFTVRFLEVSVDKTETLFTTEPMYKSTNISRPLCSTSAHPRHIHTSWIMALAKRSVELASTPELAARALERLKHRLITNSAPHHQIDVVVQYIKAGREPRARNRCFRELSQKFGTNKPVGCIQSSCSIE